MPFLMFLTQGVMTINLCNEGLLYCLSIGLGMYDVHDVYDVPNEEDLISR